MNHDAPIEKFTKVYGKSEVVFEENSVGTEMFVVCHGKVKLYSRPSNGRRTLLATLGPGEHFGEMALVDKNPRSATAVAAQDNTKLVVLDKAKFLYLVQQQPDFAFSVIETLCKRLRDTNSHLAEVQLIRRRD